jgi:hypothetical protein
MGKDRVFRDIEIPIGADFEAMLQRAIAASDALLVVIGPRWAAESAVGASSRLFEPNDWVRTEIEAAFEQNKSVIPVLVGTASMPNAGQLPPSIMRLAKLQAAVMSDRRWDTDIKTLAARLRTLCPALATDRPPSSVAPTPADMLRDIGGRLLETASSKRRYRSAYRPGLGRRVLRAIGRRVRKVAGIAVVLAAIYVGIRLFGDEAMLAGMDRLEARLQIGWGRLLEYLEKNLK